MNDMLAFCVTGSAPGGCIAGASSGREYLGSCGTSAWAAPHGAATTAFVAGGRVPKKGFDRGGLVRFMRGLVPPMPTMPSSLSKCCVAALSSSMRLTASSHVEAISCSCKDCRGVRWGELRKPAGLAAGHAAGPAQTAGLAVRAARGEGFTFGFAVGVSLALGVLAAPHPTSHMIPHVHGSTRASLALELPSRPRINFFFHPKSFGRSRPASMAHPTLFRRVLPSMGHGAL